MTAREFSSPAAPGFRADHHAPVRVGVARVLDPGHLALLAARDWGLAAARGIALILEETNVRSDGFAVLESRDCDLVVTEPLRLLEPSARGCEPLACLFETRGGVLAREDRLGKLRAGETFRVASSISGPLTDHLCRRILQGWAGSQGFAVAETQIVLEAASFDHLNNLEAGFDAAWVAHANVEGVSARQRGIKARLLFPEDVGLPGFSALELVARKSRRADEIERHEALISTLETAAWRLKSDPNAAIELWRQAGGDAAEETAAIILATLACLMTPPNRNPRRCKSLEDMLVEA